ncbi:hypothetical protein PENTCL1PPCAC_6870, partial [Pristionchus entomophagus]
VILLGGIFSPFISHLHSFHPMKRNLVALLLLLVLIFETNAYKIVKSVPVSSVGPAWRSMRVRQFANSSPLMGFSDGGFRPRFGPYKRGYDFFIPSSQESS